MAVSGLGSGIGVTLSSGDTTTSAVETTYSDIISVGLQSGNTDITDISSASSASQCAEFLPGLVDAGYFTCVLRYGASGTGAETEVGTLKSTFLARTINEWVLTIPGGASGGTWTCDGYIVKLGQAVNYQNGVQISFVIRLTGVPVWAVAAAT